MLRLLLMCLLFIYFSADAFVGARVSHRRDKGWLQQAYIKAGNVDSNDLFGSSIAISGDTLVVGTPKESSNQKTITNGTGSSSDNTVSASGAVYVYRRTGRVWVQEAYLKAPNADALDSFGASVAVDGDTIVVGAYYESSNQRTITNGTTASGDNSSANAGAVYIFKRSGTTWEQEAYLKSSNSDPYDNFGIRVAISGDSVAVGADTEASNQTSITNGTTASSDNSAAGAGAVYVFKRSGATWTQEAYIKAANAEAGDRFGNALSLNLDTLVVGAYAEASNQTTITNGTTASSNNSAMSAGAVYVYKRTGSSWAQEAYIKATNADALDLFGFSVSLNGNTIVAGSLLEASSQSSITNDVTASGDNSKSGAGAVYVFKRTGVTWAQEAYIKASNSDSGDRFGVDVSIANDSLVVGAYNEASSQRGVSFGSNASSKNDASESGAVYVFKRSGASWSQQAYIKSPNSDASDWFGACVSVNGDSIGIGAYKEDSNQAVISNGKGASGNNSSAEAGAAYVYYFHPF